MAISLLPDLMGRGEKLQLALSDYRSDTGCIEMSAEFTGPSAAKRHYCSQTIVGLTDQQKARPNCNWLQTAAAAAAAVSKYS
jgi:hypothetical protein